MQEIRSLYFNEIARCVSNSYSAHVRETSPPLTERAEPDGAEVD
jgi:hypothetical protein